MKLVFANNFYYMRGGSERVFFDEIEMLERGGNEVAPFTMRFEKNFPSPYSRFFAPELKYEGIGLAKKARASAKLVYSKDARKSFSGLLESFKPDIVHGHNIYGRLTTSIVDEAKARRVPFVMTLHDYKLVCPSYLMIRNDAVCEKCAGKSFYNCLLSRCHKGSLVSSLVYTVESYFASALKKYDWVSRFISPSLFLLKKHLEAGFPEKKLVHIPNFIKVNEFEPVYSNKGYILYVGRLSKEKGVITMLKAVKGLDVELKIVGDGPMRKEYEAFAKENGISNAAFEGYKTGDGLKDMFRGAAFIVFPSEWYENAPMSILESFAFGKPVVASTVGGVPEMVVDEKTGLLYPMGDYKALKERIKYLASSPSKIAELGRAARLKVEGENNAERHMTMLKGVYEKTA
ncbi:MAG: glycosyltransferase family 4 protein [Deltaproteobacteria bacterium]|nr:glycosyltransferase family 4 protein [Deltaproteobacteria bacterium]